MARIETDDHSKRPRRPCRFRELEAKGKEKGPKKKEEKKRRTVLTYDPWWSRSAYIKNHVQPETALSLCLRPDVITS